jgi:hypothetical protein
MFGDELWLEASCPISGDLDGQFSELAFESLASFTVTGIDGDIGNGLMFVLTQVLGHLNKII